MVVIVIKEINKSKGEEGEKRNYKYINILKSVLFITQLRIKILWNKKTWDLVNIVNVLNMNYIGNYINLIVN